MFLKRQGTAPWALAEAVEPAIDFCVSVLLIDGLRVPPFDRHSEGSGRLRAAGLDGSAWRGWFESVVAAQLHLSELVRGVGDLTTLTERDAAHLADGLEKTRPPGAWAGGGTVGDLLTSLWAVYEPDGEARRQFVGDTGGPAELRRSDRPRIWQRIIPEREPGAFLTVFSVGYPEPVVDIVSPAALVLAVGWEQRPGTYLRLLEEGLARMADAGPRVDG